MADKRISQLVDRGTVVNSDVVPIVVSGAVTTNKATISSIQTFMQGNLDLGVTSVGITLGTTGTDINVTGSPVTSSGNITINLPTASATNRGALSSADWSTFNSKQGAITLTTTGTSGVSTLVGNTLNIPNYTTDLSGYVTLGTAQTITAQKTFTTSGSSDTMIISHGSGSGFALDVIKAGSGEAIRVQKTSGSGNAMTISGGNFEAGTIVKTGGTSSQFLKADGSIDSTAYTTNTGTVTSVGLSSATSGVTIGSTPITTSGTITLAIATASGSQNGLLSSTDWTTFNGKQAALNGTGFVKISGTTISYDNSTYLTTSSAASTYLPLVGGTLTGPLIGTNSIFGSAFATNQTSKVGIGFESGYGLINSWGADASTYGGLKFQVSESDGNTYDALRINTDGTLYAPAGGYISILEAASLRVGSANGFSQALTPPVAKFINSANNFVKIALGQGETSPNFNDYYGIIALDNSTTLADNKLRFYLGYDDSANTHSNDQLVIQGDGNVGIGTASPNLSGGAAGSTILTVSASASARNAVLELNGTRTNSTDISGYVRFFNNGAATPLADIRAIRGSSDTSGDLAFETSGAERVRVTNNGLTFNGDTSADNALDDYEEGTWTMNISFGGASVGVIYSNNTGSYTKIGRKVTVIGYMTLTNKGSSTGIAIITGLPFTIASGLSSYSSPSLRCAGISYVGMLTGYGAVTQQNIVLQEVTEAGVVTDITNSDFTNTSDILLSFTYFV
jgi:hypothetical protein